MDNELLKRIKQARSNDNDAEIAKANAQRAKEQKLAEGIRVLTPRITVLIETANALIDSGYEEFVKDNFCSEGWAHHIGFMYNSNTHHIDSMGKVNGGACGGFDFHTTGKNIYMTDWYGYNPVKWGIKWENAEQFLEKFDEFESKFNTKLEEFLQKKRA